ncbi:MAG: STAS domain-containing protein [Holophaga sp.]|jgi:anti-anti-sigma factor
MLQIEPSSHEGEPSFSLEGDLTIYTVLEARDRLGAALDRQPALQLNLSRVAELDTAGVQLLVWLKQEAHRRGKALALYAHSPAVVEVFDLLQVAGLFGDPILIAPTASRG